MKNWFYIAYLNKEGDIVEYAVERCDGRFITDKMDHYIKFSGSAVRGEAYAIKEGSLRPNFGKVFAQSALPF